MNAPGSLSVIALFDNADIVVKVVLLLLLSGSVWSWAVVVDKWVRLRGGSAFGRRLDGSGSGAASAEELIGERLGGDSGPAGERGHRRGGRGVHDRRRARAPKPSPSGATASSGRCGWR